MPTPKVFPNANPNRKHRGTQSTPRHYPLFRRVASAKGYGNACAAVYRLSCELLKLGQTPATVTHDISGLVHVSDGQLDRLDVFEIVLTARRIGGAA